MSNIGDLRPVDRRLGTLLLILLYQPGSSVSTVTGCGAGDWVSVTGGERGQLAHYFNSYWLDVRGFGSRLRHTLLL